MENQMTGVKTNVLKTVSKSYNLLIKDTFCVCNCYFFFIYVIGVQMQNNHSNHSRHKRFSIFFNKLQILISRSLIISSRDSVCILHLY